MSDDAAKETREERQDFQSRMAEKNTPLDRAKELLDNPAVRHTVRVASDPFFQRASYEVLAYPRKLALLGWELGWLLVFILFRTWWMSKIPKWWKRALLTFLSLIVFWFVAVLVIPWGMIWKFDWSWLKEWGSFIGRIARP